MTNEKTMESMPLLATRLYVPAPRSFHVSRPRLLTQLEQGLSSKLILISAPAGFGKTSLLSEWIAKKKFLASWISLDAEISNSTLFWQYVITALQQLDVRIGAGALTALRSSQPPQIKLLLTGLINDLNKIITTSFEHPIILVLDDYHAITSQEIHESTLFFLDNLPRAVNLVISTRTDPPWSLARLRVRRELMEIRARDLRFTLKEAATFLNESMELSLLPEHIKALDSRTEGWAASIQMAGLALKGINAASSQETHRPTNNKNISSYIDSFSGSNRFIMDYLVEEVLDQQPEYIQNFLIHTAVLNRLSSDLCNAVTLQANTQEILAQLDHDNLFLIPLDDERRWYRYHHLFADLLSQRLLQKCPELVPQLHMRASQWYERQGLIAFAVPHALAANDIPQVTRLAEENVLGMLEHGELGYISEWLKALPDPVIHTQPWLCTACAWALTHAGRFDEANACLQQLKEILKDQKDETVTQHIYGHINAIQLYIVIMTYNGWDKAVSYAEQALALLPPKDMRTRGLVAVLHGLVQRVNHQYAAARESLSQALAKSKTTGESYAIVDLHCQLARVDAQQGYLHQASTTCREAIRQAELSWQLHNQSLPVVGYAHGTLAGIYFEWNQLEKALDHARNEEALSRQWGHFNSWIESQHLLARIYQADGRFSDSMNVIQSAKQQFNDAEIYLGKNEVLIRLLEGDMDTVFQWAESVKLSFSNKIADYYLSLNLLLARIKIARFRQGLLASLEDVINHLSYLEKQLKLYDANRDVIRILVLKAVTLQENQQNQEALTTLEQALVMAEPEGYIRTFIQEGESIHKMLQKVPVKGSTFQYVKTLLAAYDQKNEAVSLTQAQNSTYLADPLSERELEVLRLLATPLSSTEIANELFIAPSTVRSHIKNIYSKLDVHNRIESIQRAETLGIL